MKKKNHKKVEVGVMNKVLLSNLPTLNRLSVLLQSVLLCHSRSLLASFVKEEKNPRPLSADYHYVWQWYRRLMSRNEVTWVREEENQLLLKRLPLQINRCNFLLMYKRMSKRFRLSTHSQETTMFTRSKGLLQEVKCMESNVPLFCQSSRHIRLGQ